MRVDRRRRRAAIGAVAALGLLPHRRPASADDASALPAPASLLGEAAAAGRRGEALVLLISLPGCPYCEQVRRSHLVPLRQEHGGVVQLDLGSDAPTLDVDGVRQSHDAVIRARQVGYAPTVLFLDTRGAEVAERLVGFASPDFYGGYLEQRLEAARRSIAGRR